MAGESITFCAYNTFGVGFEGETGVVTAITAAPETLGLESPADGWEDCTAVRCTSSSCSHGTFLFDFRWVETAPKKNIWKSGGTAAFKDHEVIESSSFFTNKAPRSADT